MKEIDTDALIIGSGLVGLVAAHCLSSLNYKVVIVDRKNFNYSSLGKKDIRTVAVSEGSKQFLDSLSLWRNLKKYAEPIKKIKVFDRDPMNKILFTNDKTSQKLGYVIENIKFSKILIERLYKLKNVKIFYDSNIKNISFNKDFSVTNFNNKNIRSKLIVAADGKNSYVRKIAGNKIYKKNYPEKAIVINFFHKKNLDKTAYEIFYQTGPLAILPMKSSNNNFQSSIIWSNKSNFINRLIKCENKFIINYLDERIGNIIGKITKINSKQQFPLSAHLNDSFFNERLVFVGDAAHSIHPIAGQGWNLGVKDIKNIHLICKKLKSKSSFGNQIFCKKYNELSYKNAFQLFQITDKLNSSFQKTESLYRFFSNVGLDLVEKNALLKKKITKYAMGLN